MITRRRFLILGGGAVASFSFLGCGSTSGGNSTSGLQFLKSLLHTLTTTDVALLAQILPIAPPPNLDVREGEAGVVHEEFRAFLEGEVLDTVGIPRAGVSVAAHSDDGTTTGTVAYRNAAGVLDPLLTVTTTDGGFSIFNVVPGRINLRTTAGGTGNVYLNAESDVFHRIVLPSEAPPFSGISHSGITLNGDVPPVFEPSVTVQAFGFGTPVTSNLSGMFSLASLAGENEILYRLTKTGFLDTYTYLRTTTSSLATPAGDLQIYNTTQRDVSTFTPGTVTIDATKGIVNGIVRDAGGTALAGATAEIRDATGASLGDVVYSDAGGSADPGATVTSASGEFTIFNVDPGTVLLLGSMAGFQSGLPIEVFENSLTLVPQMFLLEAAAALTVSVSGTTEDLEGNAVSGATIDIVGGGSATSSGTGGFTFASLPANSRLIVTTNKT